jgi:dsDNA-binding SOS-regulon protein
MATYKEVIDAYDRLLDLLEELDPLKSTPHKDKSWLRIRKSI